MSGGHGRFGVEYSHSNIYGGVGKPDDIDEVLADGKERN